MLKRAVFIVIVLLAFFPRLHRLNAPLLDWHSWRQADTAAVSRNFIKEDFDLLHPRFDDLSNVASGLENPQGYRFVEFPIYNAVHAFFAGTFPVWSLEVWGRLVSIFCSLGALAFLYLIVKQLIDEKTALLAAFFFAVLPYNIYYGRVILPEPMLVMASLGTIWGFVGWIKRGKEVSGKGKGRWRFLLVGTFLGALAFLLKPYVLVFLLPIGYLALKEFGINWKKHAILCLSVLVSLVPFLWWRQWMTRYPEGIPVFDWLFNSNGIRFKGAWFYWLFADRLGRLILGYWGLIFFGLGLIVKPQKSEGLFFHAWLVAIFTYFAVIATGNVQHDYYQVITGPIICVFLARGLLFLLSPSPGISRLIAYPLSLIALLFALGFSWYHVRDYFNINHAVLVEAGQAVDRLVPPDAKVIAPYGGDTAFLYQTNRQGWPVGIEIDKMVKLGATHYVNVNLSDPEVIWLEDLYCVLEKNDRYIIIDLMRKCL